MDDNIIIEEGKPIAGKIGVTVQDDQPGLDSKLENVLQKLYKDQRTRESVRNNISNVREFIDKYAALISHEPEKDMEKIIDILIQLNVTQRRIFVGSYETHYDVIDRTVIKGLDYLNAEGLKKSYQGRLHGKIEDKSLQKATANIRDIVRNLEQEYKGIKTSLSEYRGEVDELHQKILRNGASKEAYEKAIQDGEKYRKELIGSQDNLMREIRELEGSGDNSPETQKQISLKTREMDSLTQRVGNIRGDIETLSDQREEVVYQLMEDECAYTDITNGGMQALQVREQLYQKLLLEARLKDKRYGRLEREIGRSSTSDNPKHSYRGLKSAEVYDKRADAHILETQKATKSMPTLSIPGISKNPVDVESLENLKQYKDKCATEASSIYDRHKKLMRTDN